MFKLLHSIKNQNNEILNLLNSGVIQYSVLYPRNLPVKLPLQNFNDVAIFEEYLSNEKNFGQMVRY